MPAIRKKMQLLLAKVETTFDTDAAPSASTDAILAIDPKIKETVEQVRRNGAFSTMSRLASVAGQKSVEITFSVEIKGSGTPGTAPRFGALLRGCAFAQTTVSSTSVTYKPTDSNHESLTIWLYIDGRVHKATGCRGDVKIKCEAGQLPIAEFTFKGRYSDPTLLALATPTLESTVAQICKSCVFTYNSKTSLEVKTTEIEINNTISMRPSLNDANAIYGFEITGRDPMLTIDPSATYETSYNFRSDALNGNTRAISWVVGATSGNIMTISAPKYNPYWPEYEDRDEIMVEKIKGECLMNTTPGDELSISFT